MSVLMCVLISLHLTAAAQFKAKLSGTLSQGICAFTVKHSTSQKIQPPLDDVSRVSASSKPSCQIVKWAINCETEGKCHKFKCSAAPSTRSKSTRIVGGTDAIPNEFPHQIYFRRPQNPPVFCGGSVLNEKYVVSAAHCFYKKDTSVFTAIAGGHNIKIRSEKEQVRQLKKVTSHEEYDHSTKFNDILIVEVDPPFDPTDNNIVRRVVLPQPNYVSSGYFVVTGWGTLWEAGPQPDILQKVTVPIITNQECQVAYSAAGISSTMLCAGYLGVGEKDACQGDSGGPLALKMANGSYLLVGVVSWSFGCAQPNSPGVYTEVVKYLDWIHDNTDIG